MEKKLNTVLEDMVNVNGVEGIVVSDRHGLCLGVKGVGSEECCSLWSSMISDASKLEPTQPLPTIVMETRLKECVVQGNEKLVLAIYKVRS